MDKGEEDKRRRDGGKGILQPLRQFCLPPIYIASKLEKGCGSSVQILSNRSLPTYYAASNPTPVVQSLYSSDRLSRETQTPSVWCRNLWTSNSMHNFYFFFFSLKAWRTALGRFCTGSPVELACFRATHLPPFACSQCQQQHTSATIFFQCLKYLFLSPHLRI